MNFSISSGLRAMILLLIFTSAGSAQNFQTRTLTEGGYSYQTVEGDPTQTRIYTLKNGLKVYISVYQDRPQVFTLIPVKAGSKNDPADNTGLAHYLEHMVFKGTSRIGAKDYAKEKPLLDSIERLYNRYRKTKDPVQRKALYRKIDKVSLEASRLCYANEYDKLIGAMGGQGTNAFTSNEQTVYMGTIPSNQIERWLVVERERFSELVPRLFHTELEAVYEEKNRALDSDDDKMQEALFSGLFKKHPYGTRTTIGTTDHLKNPSITEIKKYFARYYVPNNMAICLAGDLDPNRTIRWIDSTFGTMEARPVPKFVAPVEAPILTPIIKKVVGPSEESVMVGFRLPGFSSREALIAELVDNILQNSTAGLIDLNLNQKQKVLSAGTYLDENNDYCSHILYGFPKEGQTLAQVRSLLVAQIDSVKQGRFGDWLIPAIVNNLKIDQLKQLDNNQGRAFLQMTVFTHGMDWADYWKRMESLKGITREEVMAFARKYYGNGYVSVEKHTGKDPNIRKITKPAITPVALNKDGSSDFYKKVQTIPTQTTEPMFLDFSRDLETRIWKPGVEFLYKKNTSTPVFQLSYVVDMGTLHNPKLELATRFLDLCGTGSLSPEEFRKELFKLGADIRISSGNDRTWITVSGLQENMEASVKLLEELLHNPSGSKEELTTMNQVLVKERENQKLDKQTLLFGAMASYAKFGPASPFTHLVKNKDLPAVTVEELLTLIRQLTGFSHKVLYFGPSAPEEILTKLETLHSIPGAFSTVPSAREFKELPTDSNRVYWLDYDMVQTELYFLSRSVPYDSSLVVAANLYNEYMGGNMSSVVFQELRESKALAYSAYGGYQLAGEKGKHNYVSSYIGCQADKLPEAMNSMLEILHDLPLKETSLNLSKETILNTLKSERTTKSAVFSSLLNARKLGLNTDIRKTIYEKTPSLDLNGLRDFHRQNIKDKKFTLVLIGRRDKIDFDALRKFGPVKELKTSDIFGF